MSTINLAHDPLRAQCDRVVSGHKPRSVAVVLDELATSAYAAHAPDLYGEGGVLEVLEQRIAALLGTENAVFVVKGTMAQQSVLAAYADRAGSRRVVVHPLSHLDHDEGAAYERLHQLIPERLGELDPFTVEDLDGVGGRIAAVTVELPLRMAGYRLTPWDDLVAIAEWCSEHQVPLHLDGARLWEAAAAYERPLSEVAALGTTTYVSFYKGLGGLSGCALAGPVDVVAEAKVWADRHGANLFAAYPYVISALEGLDRHLDQMPAYRQRALTLAKSLSTLDGVIAAPDPPHVNAFQVHLDRSGDAVATSVRDIARERSIWTAGRVQETSRPGSSIVEVVVGDASDHLTDDEILDVFGQLATPLHR